MRSLVVCFLMIVVILLSTPLIHAQDLSQYRHFSFGMTVTDVCKLIDTKPADITVVHERPALIEELTWWPPQPYGPSRPAEPVDQLLFSFDNGALYRMLVTYDSSATKGLTDEDMIRVVSAKYGGATRPVAVVNFPMNPSYKATEKVIARWEDSQYSLNLFRSYGDTFAIVMFAKQLDVQAGVSIAESVKLDQEEAPQKEAARAKKNAEDLELERQKNIKTLRP
ncbi:MAG: hypothetical protein AUH86_03020 [Acidobacteria bacterium 13_1_40CM_4_58_4]|nr:MAG: hypothetical protein AUH86_03020 [Acidobacteria bacterium 13_1_40CM_4_58_4]